MATYVIVHGANGGGYQWQKVAGLLRAGGHTVFTPTLTGLGERVHLAHPGVDLDLHVLDILNVLRYEKLSDVILCAHSYGGMVITGVAEKAAGLLRRLVYIDAMVPRDGESAWDVMSAHLLASMLNAIRQAVTTAGEGRRWHGASPSALPMEAHRNLMHQPQLAELAQAIWERRQPSCTVSDGRRVLKVLDAFIKSERAGAPVRIG